MTWGWGHNQGPVSPQWQQNWPIRVCHQPGHTVAWPVVWPISYLTPPQLAGGKRECPRMDDSEPLASTGGPGQRSVPAQTH